MKIKDGRLPFIEGPWEHGTNPKWSPDVPWAISREIVVRPTGEFPHGEWIADCGLDGPERWANALLISLAPQLFDFAKRVAKATTAEMDGLRQEAADLVNGAYEDWEND